MSDYKGVIGELVGFNFMEEIVHTPQGPVSTKTENPWEELHRVRAESRQLVLRLAQLRALEDKLVRSCRAYLNETNEGEITARESEVLSLLRLHPDIQNKEIAAKLHISLRTATAHISSLLHKMGVSTRQGLLNREEPVRILSKGEIYASMPEPERLVESEE